VGAGPSRPRNKGSNRPMESERRSRRECVYGVDGHRPGSESRLVFQRCSVREKSRQERRRCRHRIITPQLYAKVNQTKFIPIVCEFDEAGEPYLPVFFNCRIYVDFSSPERANAEWEKLVRLIYDKPAIVEPELGSIPAFIKNPQSLPNMTARKLFSYREAFEKGGSMSELYRNDYLDSVVTDLERFAISRPMGIQTPGTEPFWETLERILDGMLPYPDELLRLFELHAYRKSADDPTIIADALEWLLPLKFPKGSVGSLMDANLENHSLFLHEFFVYTVALLIRARYFDGADKLLRRRFYVPGIEQHLGTSHLSLQVFPSRSRVLAEKNEVLKQNRANPIADLFQKRAQYPSYRGRALSKRSLCCSSEVCCMIPQTCPGTPIP
jgi:hypothetical protein